MVGFQEFTLGNWRDAASAKCSLDTNLKLLKVIQSRPSQNKQVALSNTESSPDMRRKKSRRGGSRSGIAGAPEERLLDPAVLQGRDPVEHRLAGDAVDPVGDEIAVPLELEALVRLRLAHARLEVGGDHFQRVRIKRGDEVLAAGVRLRLGEQAVVQAHFRFQRGGGADPVDVALDLVRVRAFGARLAGLSPLGGDRRK